MSDSRKKHTKYTSEHPEHISKDFVSPTYNTKMLADIKVLELGSFEVSPIARRKILAKILGQN